MTRILLLIALRIALCAGVIYPLWIGFGAAGILFLAPLIGIALARPLIDLTSEARAVLRHHALRHLEGRFYAYKGCPVHVVEDVDHVRWLRVADLRRIVPGLASDAALARLLPQGCRTPGRRGAPYLSDAALLELLAKASAIDTLKFRHWVEREVAFPAKRLRRDAARRGGAAGAGATDASAAPGQDSRPPPPSLPPSSTPALG